MKKIILVSILLLLSLPVVTFAADANAPLIGCFQNCPNSVVGLLDKAIIWMYTAFYIIAVGYILWAAFTFLQAGGDAKKVDEAKNRLKYAVIAIIVALVASGVSKIISGFLSNQG